MIVVIAVIVVIVVIVVLWSRWNQKSLTHSLTEWVSDNDLLSCPGQLKKNFVFFLCESGLGPLG